MSLHRKIWQLPGPSSYVRDVARIAEGGQHVLAVVPRHVAQNADAGDALAAAIASELQDSCRRVYPTLAQGALVAALGFNMTEEFEEAPVTIPALLTHPDVVGRVFICDVSDLAEPHRAELPRLLERLDAESRPIGMRERGTLVFIITREFLRDDNSSVALTRLWYWNRVARWDVAALVTAQESLYDEPGVLGEARVETIIDVAKWDLNLAVELAHEWSGAGEGLNTILMDRGTVEPFDKPLRRNSIPQPPEALIAEWDAGIVDGWHGAPTVTPTATARQPGAIKQLVWGAQSRVLLPWIEIRRTMVEEVVRQKLGAKRMAAAVDEYSTRFPGVEFDSSIVELSTLARIISARLGATENRLRLTGRALLSARNKLAHLTPLPNTGVRDLVQVCSWLE